jgi:hypothetical protein
MPTEAHETDPYPVIALRAIEATAVPELLDRHPKGAVVLERIARGAGATRWYSLRDPEQLQSLAERLSPGSSLNFYFDDRIRPREYGSEVAGEILRIAERDRDAVVGTLRADGIELDVEFIAGPRELEEYAESLTPGAPVFYGRFLARDNDDEFAVTLDLPDSGRDPSTASSLSLHGHGARIRSTPP